MVSTHILSAGPLVLWRTDGLLIAFPVVAYGFTAHQFLFNIYATLRVPSVKRMVGVVQNVREGFAGVSSLKLAKLNRVISHTDACLE